MDPVSGFSSGPGSGSGPQIQFPGLLAEPTLDPTPGSSSQVFCQTQLWIRHPVSGPPDLVSRFYGGTHSGSGLPDPVFRFSHGRSSGSSNLDPISRFSRVPALALNTGSSFWVFQWTRLQIQPPRSCFWVLKRSWLWIWTPDMVFGFTGGIHSRYGPQIQLPGFQQTQLQIQPPASSFWLFLQIVTSGSGFQVLLQTVLWIQPPI